MFFKKIFINILLSFLFYNFTISQEIIIVSKVNDEIITNIDIENEKKYLLLLNNNLEKLTDDEILNLAKNSLIREKVKKKEIDRLFDKQNEIVENKITKNFYNKLGFDKEKNFIDFLKKKEINYESLKEKIVLEALWNQIIFNNFNKRVRIDESLLKKKIIDYYNSKDKKFEYQLSEIVIGNEKDISLKKKKSTNILNSLVLK